MTRRSSWHNARCMCRYTDVLFHPYFPPKPLGRCIFSLLSPQAGALSSTKLSGRGIPFHTSPRGVHSFLHLPLGRCTPFYPNSWNEHFFPNPYENALPHNPYLLPFSDLHAWMIAIPIMCILLHKSIFYNVYLSKIFILISCSSSH